MASIFEFDQKNKHINEDDMYIISAKLRDDDILFLYYSVNGFKPLSVDFKRYGLNSRHVLSGILDGTLLLLTYNDGSKLDPIELSSLYQFGKLCNLVCCEISNRVEVDKELCSLISNEISTRIESDKELCCLISNEISTRIESDKELCCLISNEISTRIESDKELCSMICCVNDSLSDYIEYLELSGNDLVSHYRNRLSSVNLSSVDTYISLITLTLDNDTVVFTYVNNKLPPKSINLLKYNKYVSRAELKPNDKTGKRNKLVLFYNDHSLPVDCILEGLGEEGKYVLSGYLNGTLLLLTYNDGSKMDPIELSSLYQFGELCCLISNEISTRIESDKELCNLVCCEISNRVEVDKELCNLVCCEISNRVEVDKELCSYISSINDGLSNYVEYLELSNGNLVSYYDKGKRLSSLSLSSVDTYINRIVHDISNDTIVFTYTNDKLPPKSINLSKYGKDKYVSRAELKPNDKTGKRNKLVLFYNDHSLPVDCILEGLGEDDRYILSGVLDGTLLLLTYNDGSKLDPIELSSLYQFGELCNLVCCEISNRVEVDKELCSMICCVNDSLSDYIEYLELSNGNLVSYYDKGKRLSSLSLSSVDTYISEIKLNLDNDTVVFTYVNNKHPTQVINLSKYGKDKYVSRAELKPNDKTGKRNKLVLFYNDHSLPVDCILEGLGEEGKYVLSGAVNRTQLQLTYNNGQNLAPIELSPLCGYLILSTLTIGQIVLSMCSAFYMLGAKN